MICDHTIMGKDYELPISMRRDSRGCTSLIVKGSYGRVSSLPFVSQVVYPR